MHQNRTFEWLPAGYAPEQQQVRQLAAGIRLCEEVVDRVGRAGLAALRGKALQALPLLENRVAPREDERRTRRLRPRPRESLG